MISDTPFWKEFGPDVAVLSRFIKDNYSGSAKFLGLARKYHRMVEMARNCGVEGLPDTPADWTCMFDGDLYAGQHVVLLDDIVIRGTVVDSVREHFQIRHNVDQFDIVPLARDGRTHDNKKVELKFHVRDLDDRGTDRFCTEIVNAIQALGKPYDIDHPEFTFTVPASEVDSFLKHLKPLGSINNITPAFAYQHDISMWTLLPSESFQSHFLQAFSTEALHASVVKWRLFYNRASERMCACSIIVGTCRLEDLRRAWSFENWAPAFHEVISTVRKTASCNAGLAEFRVGTYFLRFALGLELAHHIRTVTGALMDFDKADLYRAFGPTIGRKVEEVTTQVAQNFESRISQALVPRSHKMSAGHARWDVAEMVKLRDEVISKASQAISIRPTLMGKVASLFEALQRILEGDAEQRLNAGERPANLAKRLLTGFNPDELISLIQTGGIDESANSDLVSLAIDLADTYGVMSPKTDVRFGDEVARYFTYGEDAAHTCIPVLRDNLAIALQEELPALLKVAGPEQIHFDRIEFEKALAFALDPLMTPGSIASGAPLSRALYCNGDGNCTHGKGSIQLEAWIHGPYLAPASDFLQAVGVARGDGFGTVSEWLHRENIVLPGEDRRGWTVKPRDSHAPTVIDPKVPLEIAERFQIAKYLDKNVSIECLRGWHRRPLLVSLVSCREERRFLFALRADLNEFVRALGMFEPTKQLGFFGKLSEVAQEIDSDRNLLPRFLEEAGKINAPAEELLNKTRLFRKRVEIAQGVEKHFQGPNEYRPLYLRYVEPVLRMMQSSRRFAQGSERFFNRVVWLSEAIGYLWDVFSKYLSIFKIRWLFPETQYVGHLTGIDKDTHELSASLASLEDLKQRSVYFGKSSADDLLAQVRDPLVGLPLDGRPNPGHLKENCKIFKAVFNNLVEIYMKDFQDKDGFLQHLGVHFPWEFAPPSFRIRSDKRGSTPKSAAEIVKLRIEMDDLRSDFKQAVADDGFTVEISDGDKISATGQSVEGTFDYLRAARGQASEHVFLRTVVVHDGDAPGSPPPTSAAEYNFPDVLYAAIDGAVKNKYQGIPGSIFAFSSGALQALGGQGEVQRRLDCALTEDQAPLKTGAKVFFCRTILYPKTRLARHATLKATR